jgi:hypothetical protein
MSLRMCLGIRGLVLAGLSLGCGAVLETTRGHAEAQSLQDCGNIYVEAEATCKVNPPNIDCEVACEPIHLQAACAGEAYLRCEGGCDAEFEAGCSASCEADCRADCQVDRGEFDCQAYCQADCSADCSASCKNSGDKTRCEASCRGSCTGDCDANCRVRPPSVDCQADCRASCTGSCHAKANVMCQVDCQSKFYVECEARLTGGCEAQCTTEAGALFCEGNYVDTKNNLDSCVQALRDKLDVEVEVYADGECVNNTCSGEIGGSSSCSALPMQRGAMGGLGLSSLIAGLCIALARRRRGR